MTPARPRLAGVLHGAGEAVFRSLPNTILHDLEHPGSESSLIWNLIYPRAFPSIPLRLLQALPALWGSVAAADVDDGLTPYFWGFDVTGDMLEGLEEILEQVDGPVARTEVDLFLRGERNLITVECKLGASFGRCWRYAAGRCPEVHRDSPERIAACRYWEVEPARFERDLEMGPRPTEPDPPPACDRHYQLARTLMVGSRLAARLGLDHGLWIFAPRRAWPALQPPWLDFVERVRSESEWRRMRVVAWEEIEALPVR